MMRRAARRRLAPVEGLEPRLCLARSFGWDGPGLDSVALTYYIANAPSSLSPAAVDEALRRAMSAWSSVAKIAFTRADQPNLTNSIDFTFGPLDGPGGALAQTWLPDDYNEEPIAGDVRFDTAERWEVGNAGGARAYDLVRIAVHELGHSLGLDHSRAPGSVMATSVSAAQRFKGLGASDVTAIRSLYASNDASAPPEGAPAAGSEGSPADPIRPRKSPGSPTLRAPKGPMFRGRLLGRHGPR